MASTKRSKKYHIDMMCLHIEQLEKRVDMLEKIIENLLRQPAAAHQPAHVCAMYAPVQQQVQPPPVYVSQLPPEQQQQLPPHLEPQAHLRRRFAL